jgi:Ferritin-like
MEAEQEPEIVVGDREQLFHLPAEAAEIEHTLMCSYLYAAFSLKTRVQHGLAPQELEAVSRWRKTILSVAIDEMAHVVLVSNLSISVGGRPHFARPNFPVAPGYFPSGVVVRLTPFDRETLDHFIFLERPKGIEHEDGDGFEHEQDYVREEAHHGLMPSVQDYRTVSHLYEALRENLIACTRRYGPDALFIGPVKGQTGPEVVDLDGVAVIDDLNSAVRAIDLIVEQGEGSPQDREDSHYRRFVAIRSEYDALSRANPEFAPAWPVATNPVMRRPPEPEDKVFVNEPSAARVLDFANAIYAMLLRLLVQAFGRTGGDAAKAKELHIGAAIELMHVLAKAATALASMPASPAHPGNARRAQLHHAARRRALLRRRGRACPDRRAAEGAARRRPGAGRAASGPRRAGRAAGGAGRALRCGLT